jgi:very-short-patch-repair endonuclease
VFGLGPSPLTKQGAYLAAVMAAGSEAALSHRSAADVWGMRPSSGLIEVTIPRGRHSVAGVVLHQSRGLDPADRTKLDGIPVTSVARTLLDLAGILKPPDLMAAIDRAERLGLFDLTAVVEALDRARGRKGARLLRRAVAAYRPSTQKSELERRFKDLIEEDPNLQSPSFNALIDGEAGTHEVDAFWQEHALAVQVDGFEFHRTRRDRERDAASDADLELAGIRVIRFTWDDVTVHRERTLRRLGLAAGLGPPAGARGEPYGPRAP